VYGKAPIAQVNRRQRERTRERAPASCFFALSLSHFLALAMVGAASVFAGELTAPKFLGAPSCASAMCHGGADEKHNQFITWSKKDFHTRAPATLSMSRSTRIAETLKIADATSDARCTVCHNPFQAIPAERKGPMVGRLEGISCESCHNAAENWLLTHTRTDLTHEQKVSAGLRDLKNLYVRANTCVACHQNLEPELRAAGHPELIFEMDGQTAAMPRHWTETNRLRGAQAWFVGDAVARRERVAQSNYPKVIDEQRSADDLARETAAQNWTAPEVRSRLDKLASTHDQFANASGSNELAQRAERLALGLERLLVALNLHKHPALSPKLDQLFKDVQSRPDFSARQFAEHLKAFETEWKKAAIN
jgi:hypothetical protein